MERKAAMMCARQLAANYPTVQKQEPAVITALLGQLISQFEEMDPKTAEFCLKDFPEKNRFLSAYELRQWTEAFCRRPAQRQAMKALPEPERAQPTAGEVQHVQDKLKAFKAARVGSPLGSTKLKPIQKSHGLKYLWEGKFRTSPFVEEADV